jgi:hypothetical protein
MRVRFPGRLVEVYRQEQASIVRQQGIDSSHDTSGKVLAGNILTVGEKAFLPEVLT